MNNVPDCSATCNAILSGRAPAAGEPDLLTATEPRAQTVAFMRKRLLNRRIELETHWQRLFPRHSFSDLRLVRSPLDWDDEAWGRAARSYHQERRKGRP
jgi:hypothetical protein